jgi:hypothetical protein
VRRAVVRGGGRWKLQGQIVEPGPKEPPKASPPQHLEVCS